MTVDKLIAKHSMLQDVRCGVSIGDGWCDLVDRLCTTIQRHYEWSHKGEPLPVVTQLKEKFGTLRFYVDGDEYVRGAVDLAESLSSVICEDCGDGGEQRTDGWIRTLCSPCYKAWKKAKNK